MPWRKARGSPPRSYGVAPETLHESRSPIGRARDRSRRRKTVDKSLSHLAFLGRDRASNGAGLIRGSCRNGGRVHRVFGVVTQSRRSALALTALGLFVLWALAFDPTAGAKLLPVPTPAVETPLASVVPTSTPAPSQIVTARAGDTLM